MATSFIKYLLETDFDEMDVDQDSMDQEDPEGNPTDSITMDVPLLIRLLEYAKEDAEDDMALHRVAEKLTELAGNGETLTMDDYDSIVGGDQGGDEMDMDDEMTAAVSVPGREARPSRPVEQENEETAGGRKAAKKAATIAKLKKDYADKMRWSNEEKRTTGRDRSGHAAGATAIRLHLKNMYGVNP